MRNRQLKVDPGLRTTYAAVMDHDEMILDLIVDGHPRWQARDLARIAQRYEVDQVDIDVEHGLLLMHYLTEQLDIPVIPWLAYDKQGQT